MRRGATKRSYVLKQLDPTESFRYELIEAIKSFCCFFLEQSNTLLANLV
jgi:hypothetical protein